jgi:hypothetical protein
MYITVQYSVNIGQYSTVHYSSVQFGTVQYSAVSTLVLEYLLELLVASITREWRATNK